MKVWEINREEGKVYMATGEFDGTSVKHRVIADSVGNLRCFDGYKIEETLALSRILELEFEEIVDWNKVPVDTKVLVSDDGERWDKGYFKQYKDGVFYCFSDGRTSWTSIFNKGYKYCKLAEV